MRTLDVLGCNVKTLTESHPSSWEDSKEYKVLKARIDTIKVYNDTAGQAIGFMTSYNQNPRTNNEEDLLQVFLLIFDSRISIILFNYNFIFFSNVDENLECCWLKC
jgi:hypothetical protein